MELFQLRGSASDGVEVGVGDGHKGSVAEDLQAPQLTEVDGLERL